MFCTGYFVGVFAFSWRFGVVRDKTTPTGSKKVWALGPLRFSRHYTYK